MYKCYVYRHMFFFEGKLYVYYGIAEDCNARWKDGYGYKGQVIGRFIAAAAKEQSMSIKEFWHSSCQHEVIYTVDRRDLAEILESLMIVRNKGKLNLLNGNDGAGMKWIKDKEISKHDRDAIVEALMEAYKTRE